jgi:hypothetical protein
VVGAPAELGAAHGLSVVGPAPPVYKAAGGGWYPPPALQQQQAHELSVVLGPVELPGRAVKYELGG